MAGREVYTERPLTPQVIEAIKAMTNYCPNLYFGTPDYPIPPVACGRGCQVLQGECKRLSEIQKVPERVRQAGLIRQRKS